MRITPTSPSIEYRPRAKATESTVPSAEHLDRRSDLHEVPAALAEFESELQARAAWNRRTGGGSNTSSLWRQYKAPSAYDRPTGPNRQIKTAAALTVERAVRQLPELHRAVLRLYYVANSHPRRICCETGLHPSSIKRFLDDARVMAQATGSARARHR